FVAGVVSLALVPAAAATTVFCFGSKTMCEVEARGAANRAAMPNGPAAPPADCGKHDGVIYGGAVASVVLLGGGLAMLLVGVQKVPVEKTSGVRVLPWLAPSTAGL